MNILICNERFLFRFGVDRALMLIGQGLRQRGHRITLMANRFDTAVVQELADRVITVPEIEGDYLNLNESTAAWLDENWTHLFDHDSRPEVAVIGGWPFFTAIPVLERKGCRTVFMDCGAVPLAGFEGGARVTQEKLREMRRQFLPMLSTIAPISEFIARSQSAPECGVVPVEAILLGADHMAQPVWTSANVRTAGDDGRKDLAALIETRRRRAEKVILNLGRWEPGCYKNSEAVFDLVDRVRRKIPKVAILVLADAQHFESSARYRDTVVPIGFPDDGQLQAAMREADLGVSVSLWEGFNLPLAEMQWLEKSVLAFNEGANPEVVAHPWFLCKDRAEMASKAIELLNAKGPDRSVLEAAYVRFHSTFQWSRVVSQYEDLLVRLSPSPRRGEFAASVLVDVSNACRDPANSGVIRVTRRLCRELQRFCAPTFVVWGGNDLGYVLPTRTESDQLSQFNGPVIESSERCSPDGARIRLVDSERSESAAPSWLLLTETVLESHGKEIRAYAKRTGLRIAAIFYDAIPVLRPEFVKDSIIRDNHASYMRGLAECDLVVPISHFSADSLRSFWKQQGTGGPRVVANLLPGEFAGARRITRTEARLPPEVEILCVSTLEPRKNHAKLIDAVNLFASRYPDLEWKLTLVGNRYAGADDIAALVQQASVRNARIQWLGIVDDSRLHDEYQKCTFTVYASEIEGFGMPILESLWHAKPCICHHQGVMSEIAADGGCLTTDVTDVDRLATAIADMATNHSLYSQLAVAASVRPIKTWKDYAAQFWSCLAEPTATGTVIDSDQTRNSSDSDDVSIVQRDVASVRLARNDGEDDGRQNDNGRDGGQNFRPKRILICSNLYPPDFIGGAELIAHQQCKQLIAAGHQVQVFAGDIRDVGNRHDMRTEVHEGVTVHRVHLVGIDYQSDFTNFSHPAVERHFSHVLKAFAPDILHCHNIIGLSVTILALAREAGVKVVVTLHDYWGICFKNTLLKNNGAACVDVTRCGECQSTINDGRGRNIPMRMRQDYMKLAMEAVHAFVAPSDYLAATYVSAGIPGDKMNVVSNGIDFEKFSAIKRKKSGGLLRFSFFGYFGRHKGIHTLLDALPLLKDRTHVQINLVGRGDERAAYERQLQENGCADVVKFWGHVDNSRIDEVYAETDVLVLPSIWRENQPVSITEAMAAGIPVIGSDMGGIPELVEDGVTGFVFQAGDAQDLADKMEQFIADRSLTAKLGSSARSKMSENSFARQVGKLERLYDDLLRNGEYAWRHMFPLVACVGHRVDASCAAAMSLVPMYFSGVQPRVVMAQWLTETQLQSASIVWVVDSTTTLTDIAGLARRDLPFLVPGQNAELREACRSNSCGLYYGDEHEAAACVAYLLTHPRHREIMAHNARVAYTMTPEHSKAGGEHPASSPLRRGNLIAHSHRPADAETPT